MWSLLPIPQNSQGRVLGGYCYTKIKIVRPLDMLTEPDLKKSLAESILHDSLKLKIRVMVRTVLQKQVEHATRTFGI